MSARVKAASRRKARSLVSEEVGFQSGLDRTELPQPPRPVVMIQNPVVSNNPQTLLPGQQIQNGRPTQIKTVADIRKRHLPLRTMPHVPHICGNPHPAFPVRSQETNRLPIPHVRKSHRLRHETDAFGRMRQQIEFFSGSRPHLAVPVRLHGRETQAVRRGKCVFSTCQTDNPLPAQHPKVAVRCLCHPRGRRTDMEQRPQIQGSGYTETPSVTRQKIHGTPVWTRHPKAVLRRAFRHHAHIHRHAPHVL